MARELETEPTLRAYALLARWSGHRAYLRVSRQRHRLRWWLVVSASAGQHGVRYPHDAGGPALRVPAFRHGKSKARP